MPDHIHVLALTHGPSLIEMIRRLKGRSAADLRRRLGIRGVWQASFHDQMVREPERLIEILRYVLNNPVRAGLVREWRDY